LPRTRSSTGVTAAAKSRSTITIACRPIGARIKRTRLPLILRRIGPRQRCVGQCGMRTSEIGARRILTDLDDAAADRARAAELLEQGSPVPSLDRVRQLG